MRIDLARLQQFYYVAQEGSLTKAAQKINISTPSLSRAIRYFEHSLKTRLFERVPTGMTLTLQGKRLYEHAKKMITQQIAYERIFRENDNEIQGEIRILTTPFVGAEWLIPNLKEFCDSHPQVFPRIILKSENINPTEVDVTIVPYFLHQPHLIQNHLFTTDIRLYASQEYIDRNGIPKSLTDLDEHKLISYRGDVSTPYGSINWILHAGRDATKSSRESYLQIDTLHGLFNGALKGYGIAELPNYSIIRNSPLIEILPHEEGPNTPMYFTFSEARKQSKKICLLYDYLVNKKP